MKRLLLIISLFVSSLQAFTSPKLQNVYLSDYGLTDRHKVERTLQIAIADLDGKRLILPDNKLNKIGFVSPVRRYEALDRCTAAANVI